MSTNTQRTAITAVIFVAFLTLGLVPLQWFLVVIAALALSWGLYCTQGGGNA